MTQVSDAQIKPKWRRTGKVIIKHFLSMVAQLIPVAIGVYLGIVASDWNTDRKQRATQKEFLTNLYLEMLTNKQKLEKAAAYHASIVASADSVRKSLNREVLNKSFWSAGGWRLVKNWQGVQVPTLVGSVYQTGIISNTLLGLDFKTVNTIAQTYNLQQELKDHSHRLFLNKIGNINNETTADVLGNFGWLGDLVFYEKELINEYTKSMKQVKAKADTL